MAERRPCPGCGGIDYEVAHPFPGAIVFRCHGCDAWKAWLPCRRRGCPDHIVYDYRGGRLRRLCDGCRQHRNAAYQAKHRRQARMLRGR